jgi:hypothetical protein
MKRIEISQKEILKELQTIPGIGKACSQDLWNLGIRRVSDLKGKNPAKLYSKLNSITGTQNDVCMLYVLRCAVYFASEKRLSKAKLNWWYWKDTTYNE